MSRILLCAGASAALHKAVDLASKLTQDGHELRSVLSPSAARLIAPQLFEAVTGQPAASEEFGPERRGAMDHVTLGAWAEAVVVAPATADLVGRIALGLAPDLLGSTLLAVAPGVPRLVAPAMNPHMLAALPVQRNLASLRADGWRVLEPETGRLACDVQGAGRLPEVDALRAAIRELLEG